MRYKLIAAMLPLFSCLGCSFSEDIHISYLMQAHRSHEVIQEVEAKLAAGRKVSSFYLYFLCEAYSNVRRYDKVLSSADLLQRSIDTGDNTYFSGSLKAYPQILRARITWTWATTPRRSKRRRMPMPFSSRKAGCRYFTGPSSSVSWALAAWRMPSVARRLRRKRIWRPWRR